MLTESWDLESGIHQRMQSGIQVVLANNPEYRTWNLESTAWNREFKTGLDSLT